MMETGNRMKENYENRYRYKLARRIPVIIRLDGKNFHTLTKRCEKPFDKNFSDTMKLTALCLCQDIQGAKCAYTQSDEISILVTDFDSLETEAWFDYNIQKLTSISAGLASSFFTINYWWDRPTYIAVFDSRAFNLPKEEVCNYFVWRQKDWVRNSMQMLARDYFSHKELYKKNTKDIHEMLYEKGVNWSKLESRWKSGIFICREESGWITVSAPPFSSNRQVIERYLNLEKGE